VNRHGDTYTLEAGFFHSTQASEATTIAVGMARPGATDLSLGAVDCGAHIVSRQRCDSRATATAARLVADQLSL
jgi:hypothetical protein